MVSNTPADRTSAQASPSRRTACRRTQPPRITPEPSGPRARISRSATSGGTGIGSPAETLSSLHCQGSAVEDGRRTRRWTAPRYLRAGRTDSGRWTGTPGRSRRVSSSKSRDGSAEDLSPSPGNPSALRPATGRHLPRTVIRARQVVPSHSVRAGPSAGSDPIRCMPDTSICSPVL